MKTKFWLWTLWMGSALAWGAEDWQIAWTRQLPERAVAWSNTINMPRDSTYSMAVSEKLVIIGTTTDSALRAYDITTGQEQWRYAFSAPVRWAPVIAGDAVVAGSDDGTLAAINLADGKLRWRYVPGPGNAWCVGHERLVSLWPITTSPGVENGVVYGCAGAFVFDGVFIFAVDLKTGEERWLRRVEKRLSGAVSAETNLVSIGGYVVDAATGSPVAGAKVMTKPRLSDPIPSGAGLEDPTWPDERILQSRVLAERLVCLTSGNRLKSFAHRPPAKTENLVEAAPPPAAGATDQLVLAKALADKCDAGWVLVAGLKDGQLVAALAAQPFHRVIAIETDPARLAAVRAALQKNGTLSGNRVQIVQAPLADLPPWVFSLIVTEQDQPVDAAQALRKLRPFGGMLAIVADQADALRQLEPGLDTQTIQGLTFLRRPGRLPGTEDWTDERTDASHRNGLSEPNVKLPLGTVWYGGYAADKANYFITRFAPVDSGGHQIPALITSGRWILQGDAQLTAIDQYNSRRLWSVPLPGWWVYEFYGKASGGKIKPWNDPAANKFPIRPTQRCRAAGYSMAAAPDAVYLCVGPDLWHVNQADGAILHKWPAPFPADGDERLCFGQAWVAGDLLLATIFSERDMRDAEMGWDNGGGSWSKNRMKMSHLIALDRHTGQLRWTRQPKIGFLNDGIAVGNGRVYVNDLLSDGVLQGLIRTGHKLDDVAMNAATISAFDLQSGKPLWQQPLTKLVQDIQYDAANDLLLLPSRAAWVIRDGKWVEDVPANTKGPGIRGKQVGLLVARRGATGAVLYEQSDASYKEPFSIVETRASHRSGLLFDLLKGELLRQPHPVTGAPASLDTVEGGCTYLLASRYFSGFRCGWNDLPTGLSGPVGDYDSGCIPNWVTAGGLMNSTAQSITRFRNRPHVTAFTATHRPGAEFWCDDKGLSAISSETPLPVKQLGILPGAPGNRFDEQSRIWLRFGADGRCAYADNTKGKAPAVFTGVTNYEVPTHRIQPAPGLPAFVGGYGLIGLTSLNLRLATAGTLSPDLKLKHTITLVFLEPGKTKPGERVFAVTANGRDVVTDLDIAKEAGRRVAITRTVTVETTGKDPVLRLEFAPKAGSQPAILSGIFIAAVER